MSIKSTAVRFGFWSALLLVVGVVLSGPLTVIAVSLVKPQPVEWQGIDAYARAFDVRQLITYWFGFLIILGFIGVIAAVHQLATEEQRLWTVLALVFVAMFGAVIGVNYTFQLAVLRPAMQSGRLSGMELFAFNNPDSVAMSLEMLGYGFAGLATLFVAPVFQGGVLERWIRWLGIANGLVSVLGTALHVSVGVRGLPGLIVYAAWNVLFAALCVLYVVYMRREVRSSRASSDPATSAAA